MLRMVSYPRRPQCGHLTCYLNRTYHVLPTGESLLLAKRWPNQCVESTPITRPIRDCPKTKSRVRLSYHADQSFHEGTSRSSRAAPAPPRYSCGRSAGRQYRGWEHRIDAAQETGSSSKTCDRPGYRTTGSECGPKRADVKQQGS